MIHNYNLILGTAAVILLAGCTARFEELNTNPNQVTAGQM